uniref:Neuropeptide-Like Protein n=1 Tax=Syphacia muris TaxID=451379 RepID=A0A0N5ASE4_9BILA
MLNIVLILLTVFAASCIVTGIPLQDAGIYGNDELNRIYAMPNERTRIYTGEVGRYAPKQWPSWYQRMVFRWNGHSRIAPYHPNDSLYPIYRARLLSESD